MHDPIARLNEALQGRYRIDREVGQGGMATVYLADDLRHQRKVAIKVLKPELAEVVGGDRFLREIRVTANLQHPHILPLFDSGEAEGILFYVMPYVAGESLRDRLAAEGMLPIHDAARILREVVDALGEAHRHGIVHRDVKPGNILLAGRHALVADFGVARAVTEASGEERLTTIGSSLGTPRYMAPEQAAADPDVDHRADLFAAGVIGYEMLTGESPFAAGSSQATLAALLTKDPPPVSELRDGVPAKLSDAVMRCLEKEPADRWQDAAELLAVLETVQAPDQAVQSGSVGLGGPARRFSRLGMAGVAVAASAVLLFSVLSQDQEAWAREQALPEIERLVSIGDWGAAHRLAARAEEGIPEDGELEELRATFATRRMIETEPLGATVYRRDYSATGDEWELLGVTPIDNVSIPWGASRFRIELEGHRPVEFLSTSRAALRGTLDPNDVLPAEMVRVAAFQAVIGEGRVELADFFMDRYEVTNAEYKEFVDAGGYERADLWQHRFVDGDRTLSLERSIASFVDRTGRPGPSTWEVASYPEGQENFPVAGVSWYEAAAYAVFRGKDLPTVHHWQRALNPGHQAHVIPLSNIAGSGPAEVGAYAGVTLFGAYDMVGNVREWTSNELDGQRYTLGGGWNDAAYLAAGPFAQPAMDRSETNGIRLVRYLTADEGLEAAKRPVPRTPVPDFESFEPISDDLFEVYRRQFQYDAAPLGDLREAADTTRYWVRERISFDAGYGDERLILYLYLPRDAEPPYQVVLYYPGAGALNTHSIDEYSVSDFDFLLRSGRAVAFPVYRGTFERPSDISTRAVEMSLPFASSPRPTNLYREHVTQWGKELRRTIDYLETRPDVDVEKLAYYGSSWGGRMGSIMLAVEPRFKVAVLRTAGFSSRVPHPEVHAVNYAARVTVPVLMVNGRYDHIFPLETNARPMYERLGTAEAQKELVISDGGHFVPQNQLIAETLDWLDRYLGPVR